MKIKIQREIDINTIHQTMPSIKLNILIDEYKTNKITESQFINIISNDQDIEDEILSIYLNKK